MKCIYCNKECKNKNSLKQHEIRCNENPNKIKVKSNFIEYNNKVKNGEIDKKFINQYDKAIKLGLKKPEFSNEALNKMSKANKGRKHNKKTKEILSEKRSKYLEESGNGGFKNIKWYSLSNIKGEDFIVRGTWELKVAEWLNNNNYNWIRKVYLKYFIENVEKTYTPDFYLPDYDIYIEVKGYFSQIDQNKIKLVLENNDINLKMIFSNTINKLNSFKSLEELLKD